MNNRYDLFELIITHYGRLPLFRVEHFHSKEEKIDFWYKYAVEMFKFYWNFVLSTLNYIFGCLFKKKKKTQNEIQMLNSNLCSLIVCFFFCFTIFRYKMSSLQQIRIARRYWMSFSNVPNETSFIVQWWVNTMNSVKPINKLLFNFTEDVLTDAKGECVICLEDLNAGDVIARLPCLCIYHKGWVHICWM